MKKDNYDALAMTIVIVVGCLIVLFVMVGATTPKCIESNCNKKQVDGSGYCDKHQPSRIPLRSQTNLYIIRVDGSIYG